MQDSDRLQGYVTDASYTDRFFRELSPSWLAYVAALHGLTPCRLDGSFAYLELGCGLGTSVVVNAGAYPRASFHACDINPAHIAGARGYAAALGVGNLTLHEASFEDLVARELPPFDVIVLHGVYSWVTPAARAAIRRVIATHAKPGALVYVGYNCLPGWASEVPLRRLLMELAETADGDSAERTSAGVRDLKALADSSARYFSTHPAAMAAVESYTRSSGNYLAHEFLNESWEPFYSVDVADEMATCGLHFVGSATLADNHPMLVVDAKVLETIASLRTPRQRQLAMDFAANQRFRRDVFVSGRVRPDGDDHVSGVPIGLAGVADIPPRVRVPRGEIRFQPDFVRDLTAMLSGGPMTIGTITRTLARSGHRADDITRNLTFLVAGHSILPCAHTRTQTASPSSTLRYANTIVERAIAQAAAMGVSRAIPCEVAGNGVLMHPVEAIGIRALVEEHAPPERLAAAIERAMRAHNLRLTHENETLADAEAIAGYAPAAAEHVLARLVPACTRLALLV